MNRHFDENANMAAFGMPIFEGATVSVDHRHFGLTKREYIASQSLQGILANPSVMESFAATFAEEAARHNEGDQILFIAAAAVRMAAVCADSLLYVLDLPDPEDEQIKVEVLRP